jgi:predicted Zn-dependent protease
VKIYRLLALLVIVCGTARCIPAAEKGENFVFGKADLEFLKEVELLDQRYEREGMVYHDEALNAYVTRIGMSMLPAGTAPEHVKWAFKIVRDPMANAYALPNGSIFVTTGLLSLLDSEDQLASVVAHEITHVTDRHAYLGNRDYRKKSTIVSFAQFAGRMAPGNSNWGASIQLAALMVPAIMNFSILGYRRELERDADMYAFTKIIEGNYDPREMPKTFRLLEERDEAEPPPKGAIYSDHPKLEDRIGYINAEINSKAPPMVSAEALAERRARYQNLTEGIVREDIRISIMAGRPRTALARANKLLQFHPDSADNLYSQAEAYRGLGPWTSHPMESELTRGGLRRDESLASKFTYDEEERVLLRKPEGQATWSENKAKAQDAYEKALAVNPNHAKAYLGLGRIYELDGKKKEALMAYQKYLELNPDGQDSFSVTQRIAVLKRSIDQ